LEKHWLSNQRRLDERIWGESKKPAKLQVPVVHFGIARSVPLSVVVAPDSCQGGVDTGTVVPGTLKEWELRQITNHE